jgi:hypothetical protein
MLKTFDRERLLHGVAFLVCLMASFLLELWTRKCGFLLTPDSYEYLSASRTFKASGFFIGTAGNYYTQWPPLFPIVLSMFADPFAAMVWIQVVCKGIIALVIVFLANRFLKNTSIKIIFFAGVWLSVHMLMISVFLWSEIIFMTLFMVHLFVCLNLTTRPMYYYVMTAVSILFCLQRNAGLFLVFSTAVWMLTDNSLVMEKKRVKAISYTAICTVSLFCWYYYNIFFMIGSKPFYERDFFVHTGKNIELILLALNHVFFPFRGKTAVIGGTVISVVFILGCYRHFKAGGAVRLLILMVAIYTMGFLAVPNLDIHEMERFFSVILPVFLILVLLFVEHVFANQLTGIRIAILFLSVWIVYSAVRTGKNALQWHEMSCTRVSDK